MTASTSRCRCGKRCCTFASRSTAPLPHLSMHDVALKCTTIAVGAVCLMPRSLQHTLPELADELSRLLQEAGHECLARQVPALTIMDRCRCGDEFCATFYTQPKPLGAYGAGHENIELQP